MSPAADQAALLVVEMRQFDLQSPFCGRCPLAEDFEDQARAVDDLTRQLLFEITLLDRTQRTVDNNQFGVVLFAGNPDVFDLACPEQEVRPNLTHRKNEAVLDLDTDGERQPLGLAQTAFGVEVIAFSPNIGANDKGPRTARNLAEEIVVEAQLSSSSQSSVRSTGVAGWMVETACL